MSEKTSRLEWSAFAAVMAVASAWRFTGLGAESLWTDEIAAVLVSGRSLLEVLLTIGVQDVNPPLFYLLTHFWLLGGQAEWWLRLLPALLGLLAVALTWRLGRRLSGKAVGLLAALFAAFSPLSVYLSRELRYHTLLAVLTLATLLFALRYFRYGEKRDGRLLFAASVLGLYTHYFFLFAPAILIVWRWQMRDEKTQPWFSCFKPFLAALVVFAPWLLFLALQAARASYRFRPIMGLGETLFDLASYFTVGHADNRLPLDPGGIARFSYLLALAPFWALAIAGWTTWKQYKATRLATVGFGLPIITVLIVGRFLPVYGHRYLLPFLPLFLVFLAVGAVNLWRFWKPLGVMVAVAALVLATGSNAVQRIDPHFQREDWRGLADMLHSALQPGDALLAYNDSQVGPLRYYWQRQFTEPFAYDKLLGGDPLTFAEQPPGEIEARVNLYRTKARRLWLLDHFAHMYDPPGRARAALAQTCVEDKGYSLEAVYRVPVRVYWRDLATALAEVGSRFAPRIVFGEGGFDAMQLAGDWTHTDEEWAWLGRSGVVYLRVEEPADAIALRVLHTAQFHDGEPLLLSLRTEDYTLANFALIDDREQTLTAALLQTAQPGEILAFHVEASGTFDPAEKIGGEDHSPKSVQIHAIALIGVGNTQSDLRELE